MGNAATGSVTDGSSRGQFTLETVLTVFKSRSDRARPLTANDMMDELGCSRRTAHNKLNDLVEQETLATRKVGARGRVWWVPLDAPVDSRTPACTKRAPSVEMEIEGADLPGSGETLEQRREALRAAYDYLSENPNAAKMEFLTEVFPDYPAGYKTADKWWDAIKPALKELPNVDVAQDREHVWHYVGG